MTQWCVVATDSTPGWDWSVERAILSAAGAALVTHQCRTPAEAAAAMAEADVVFNQLGVALDAGALAAATRLRAVIIMATGYDHVDLAAASARGIAVANVHGYCTEEVSEHALALLLALGRKLFPQASLARRGEWDYGESARPAHRFRGRTLGLYGFGQIARRLAAKAQPLGVRLLVLDPYVPAAAVAAAGAEPARDLDQLLAESDYLSLHVPLTPETAGVINYRTLARMKAGSYLVNCSRGGLIQEAALLDALKSGHLAGAALDVLAQEPPPPDHPLLRLDNCIVTPHGAWFSLEAEHELSTRAAEAAVATLRGVLPPGAVNADKDAFSWVVCKS